MDMETPVFEEHAFGKAALRQLGDVPENFRLYEAGWLGERPEDFRVMEVKGAEFRHAKTGPNKGKLAILVPGTVRTAYVTKDEIAACLPTGGDKRLEEP